MDSACAFTVSETGETTTAESNETEPVSGVEGDEEAGEVDSSWGGDVAEAPLCTAVDGAGGWLSVLGALRTGEAEEVSADKLLVSPPYCAMCCTHAHK